MPFDPSPPFWRATKSLALSPAMTLRHATALETVTVVVPADGLEAYEAALATACGSIGFFLDEPSGLWTIEGVKDQGTREPALTAALAIAAAITGIDAKLTRRATEADGWLARTRAAFPEQTVGKRFVIRGTHLTTPPPPGRRVLTLDAGVAFGSGEHGSTRGCLRALERISHRRPRRVLDMGTGSGILAMAAARILHRKTRGLDIDPWSVRTASQNATRNQLGRLCRFSTGNGWFSPMARGGAPYDLVFANILARPLCTMARDLAQRLAPGGTAILAGMLVSQVNWVLAAHRRRGLRCAFTLHEGGWATLVLHKPFRASWNGLSHTAPGCVTRRSRR